MLEGQCQIWTRAKNTWGYGQRWWQGRQVNAHRVAWEIAHGPIPDGLFVLHHCDVRACVNPDHLYLGTQADNMRDKVARGRYRNSQMMQTTCKNGHLFDKRRGRRRICSECNRAASIRYLRSQGVQAYTPPKTCKRGHEFSVDNTYYYGPKKQYRMCRTCHTERQRGYIRSKV